MNKPVGQQHVGWLVLLNVWQKPPLLHVNAKLRTKKRTFSIRFGLFHIEPAVEQFNEIYDVFRMLQSSPDQPIEQIFDPVVELHVYELEQSSFGMQRIEHW